MVPDAVGDSLAAADGQHGHRLGSPAGGRVRACAYLGQPSPYLDIAFPNHIRTCARYLDPEELSPREPARVGSGRSPVPATGDLPHPQAGRAQVAAAHLPCADARRGISRRAVS